MASIDKLMQLHQIFDGQRTPISVAALADRLECSEKTVRRYIHDLQNELGAPLINATKGWFYDRSSLDDWQVPGLWMTKEESQAILLLLDMLGRFGNGLLNDELRSIRSRVDKILEKRGVDRAALEDKIHIVPVGQRALPTDRLQQVTTALVDNKRLSIRYRDFNQKSSNRTISPQRLVYYRDNWYVAAWCHARRGLRIFSLARIEHCALTEDRAISVTKKILNRELDSAYGVFTGEPKRTAVLRFLPAIANEIAIQQWHPAQRGRWEDDEYVLTIPYSESKELLQDVLKHLPSVCVDEPAELRDELQRILAASLESAQQMTG